MVVTIACTCDDLPPHSHIYEITKIEELESGLKVARQELNEFEVRIWVDWKAVAKEVIINAMERD